MDFLEQLFQTLEAQQQTMTRSKEYKKQNFQSNYDWDDELDESMKAEWMTFQQNLQEIKSIKIPRWIFNDEAGPIDMPYDMYRMPDPKEGRPSQLRQLQRDKPP